MKYRQQEKNVRNDLKQEDSKGNREIISPKCAQEKYPRHLR
jgi:hypothetical protein